MGIASRAPLPNYDQCLMYFENYDQYLMYFERSHVFTNQARPKHKLKEGLGTSLPDR